MFEKLILIALVMGTVGCSARHTEGPQEPVETASSQPEQTVEPAVEKPEPTRPATSVASTVATSDALHGRWELYSVTSSGNTRSATMDESLIVHFCADGRAKFESSQTKEYFDGFQLDTSPGVWEILLLKENAQSKRLMMRFVEGLEIVDYAPAKECPPEDNSCLGHDWTSINATPINVNQIRRSTTPANCD